MSEQFTFATTRLGLLIDQYDTSYDMLRARLDGLTDEEYFWEPVAGCWSVRRRAEAKTTPVIGRGEWVFEKERGDPQPAPFTTLAWRLCHVVAFMGSPQLFQEVGFQEAAVAQNGRRIVRFVVDNHSNLKLLGVS